MIKIIAILCPPKFLIYTLIEPYYYYFFLILKNYNFILSNYGNVPISTKIHNFGGGGVGNVRGGCAFPMNV